MTADEATDFNIPATDRCLYIRLDPTKTNIAARAGDATWFRLIGVPIGNATDEYPNGDTIQVGRAVVAAQCRAFDRDRQCNPR